MRPLNLILSLSLSLPVLFAAGCDLESKSVGDPTESGGGTETGDPTETGGDTETGGGTETGESEAAMCIADNLPADGHGWESDDADECAQPPPGSDPIECPDPIDVLEQECADEGNPCDHEQLITRDAALCLATLYGLVEGLEPWQARLLYHYGVDRAVWVIENTLSSTDCTESGDSQLLDAETGALLEQSQWMSTC